MLQPWEDARGGFPLKFLLMLYPLGKRGRLWGHVVLSQKDGAQMSLEQKGDDDDDDDGGLPVMFRPPYCTAAKHQNN